MNLLAHLLVLDTNVLVRGMLNQRSASGKVVDGCRSRTFHLLLSKPVMMEYREVLNYREITELSREISEERVGTVLRRLNYVGDYPVIAASRFVLERDPRDEKFIELAIAGKATHLVTYGNDLLSLRTDHLDAGRRFRRRTPGTQILKPEDCLMQVEIVNRES